jgi:uncharacterized protein (DUF608 family)
MFRQLCVKQLKQGECVGGAASETGNNLTFIQAPYFASFAFHDGVSHRYLTIAADHNLIATAYR